jgi:hypothetical protein
MDPGEEKDKEENQLFMRIDEDGSKSSNVWYIDSGCSNHMTGQRHLFKELGENHKTSVKMCNGKSIHLAGRCTVTLDVDRGGHTILNHVQYSPSLDYNLISVGQLMRAGYSLLFNEGACMIKHKKTKEEVCKVKMANNNVFLLDIRQQEILANGLAAVASNESSLWHKRYGHLHEHGLGILYEKNMVTGLPEIETMSTCEWCALGKQSRRSFPNMPPGSHEFYN